MKDEKNKKKQREEQTDDKFEVTDENKSQIEKLNEQIENLEDQLKRAVADYRNLENRVREEKFDYIKYANKELIEQLLPGFDTLLLAEKYTEDQNFKITVRHVLDVLRNAGIERVESVGEDYNPETMEAVEIVEGEKNKVVEETQPGFLLNGKVIRPARVKVGGETESGSKS